MDVNVLLNYFDGMDFCFSQKENKENEILTVLLFRSLKAELAVLDVDVIPEETKIHH